MGVFVQELCLKYRSVRRGLGLARSISQKGDQSGGVGRVQISSAAQSSQTGEIVQQQSTFQLGLLGGTAPQYFWAPIPYHARGMAS